MATIVSIPEMYTDRIEEIGVVRRIYFHARIVFDDGSMSWEYFGTDPAEVLPTTADPVNEHPYIQLPDDIDDLPNNYQTADLLYSLATTIAYRKNAWVE